jgi:hypothetical protein
MKRWSLKATFDPNSAKSLLAVEGETEQQSTVLRGA